ncbi:hypothetical protein ACJMK2_003270 [Sinanodonta woodiana]|uniref:Myb-like domain-containing protein n=1 Tax=Sinanodonta woodiana TaxID=1069815 RepID=A0ABD3XXS8_SINWO
MCFCRQHASNPYLFASQSKTGFIDTWKVLQKVEAEAGCVMSLKEGELDWLSSHLGHEVDTHKTYYRLHESFIELAKISRLLMAVDMGQVAKYKGKTMEDIVIDDLKDILDVFNLSEDAEICELDAYGDESDEEGSINLHSCDAIDVLMTIYKTNTGTIPKQQWQVLIYSYPIAVVNSECLDKGDESRESEIAKSDMLNGSSTDSEADPPRHQRRLCKRNRNHERQNDDAAADQETDDEMHPTKKVCTRTRKNKWTEEEKTTIKTASGHLLMKGHCPVYSRIESLQDKKICLQRRSNTQIKSKCHQLINKEY